MQTDTRSRSCAAASSRGPLHTHIAWTACARSGWARRGESRVGTRADVTDERRDGVVEQARYHQISPFENRDLNEALITADLGCTQSSMIFETTAIEISEAGEAAPWKHEWARGRPYSRCRPGETHHLP